MNKPQSPLRLGPFLRVFLQVESIPVAVPTSITAEWLEFTDNAASSG